MNKGWVIQNKNNCARLNCRITNVVDYITLILDTSEYILTNMKSFVEKEIKDASIDVGDIVVYNKRLYCFISKNKFFTVFFPIQINTKKGMIHLGNTNLLLSSISRVRGAIPDLFKSFCLSSYTIEEVNNLSTYILSKNEIRFVERLISVEFGYVRYDYDNENKNGRIHPLNHLDLNFDNAHYKLGLYGRLSPYEFLMIFGRNNTEECCYFEKKYKPKWLNSIIRKLHL